MTQFNTHLTSCKKRSEDTQTSIQQIQQGVEDTNAILKALKEKDQELQATFEKIDRLEIMINQVKETYNKVASNVDKMERTIAASTPFRLTQRSTPVQPYFPPPDSVTIFSTDELFKSLE
ncbi:hypothetical protein A0J61_02175 [Choanephora cucurbitarum]|uniref:Uncharacterized protein n=1 Tax=Choanephora cucurbitarum TaxID=101091 RepID=A0A1C7NKV3_9FUNG|nr:hypothetical protein A0J61_02175 [Choanephora cucurbitarum]